MKKHERFKNYLTGEDAPKKYHVISITLSLLFLPQNLLLLSFLLLLTSSESVSEVWFEIEYEDSEFMMELPNVGFKDDEGWILMNWLYVMMNWLGVDDEIQRLKMIWWLKDDLVVAKIESF